MSKRLAVSLIFAATIAAPLAAQAQRRSPLADAPAIRKRLELRSTRFELSAGVGTTVNQAFYHGLMATVRAGFHFTDWLSISGIGAFNVASIGTAFQSRVVETLPDDNEGRTPSSGEARSAWNKTSMGLGGQVELTPFTGKFSLFGKFFAHYDFYFFGGPIYVNLAAAGSNPADVCGTGDATHCLVSGSKIGATYGVGFHSFFNRFVALNVELRDMLFKDNPAGRDVNGDTRVNDADLTWTPHLMAIVGLTLYLPATPDITP